MSISSSMKNAFIDFSKMDVSTVALATDIVIDGEPVIGYGFHSNSRHAPSGIIHKRIIPRIMESNPEDYLTDDYEGC